MLVARTPTKNETKTVEAALWKLVGGSKMAGRRLKKILEGGTLVPSIVITQRQVSLLIKRHTRKEERPKWEGRQGTLVNEVRKALQNLGFRERGPFWWKHDKLNDCFDARLEGCDWNPGNRLRIMHLIREAYRLKEWDQFVKEKRHAARACARVECSPARWKATRKMCDTATKRVIVTAGVMSPLALEKAKSQDKTKILSTSCPWCGEGNAHHEHVVWQCRQRPTELVTPACSAQRTLGFAKGEVATEQYDEEGLRWMEQCAEEVWKKRYGNRGAAATREEAGREEAIEEERELNAEEDH